LQEKEVLKIRREHKKLYSTTLKNKKIKKQDGMVSSTQHKVSFQRKKKKNRFWCEENRAKASTAYNTISNLKKMFFSNLPCVRFLYIRSLPERKLYCISILYTVLPTVYCTIRRADVVPTLASHRNSKSREGFCRSVFLALREVSRDDGWTAR